MDTSQKDVRRLEEFLADNFPEDFSEGENPIDCATRLLRRYKTSANLSRAGDSVFI